MMNFTQRQYTKTFWFNHGEGFFFNWSGGTEVVAKTEPKSLILNQA